MKLEEKALEQEVQQQREDREFQNFVFSNVNGHLHYTIYLCWIWTNECVTIIKIYFYVGMHDLSTDDH